MVCSACGRKVDPNRSFCPNCGSMVFVDESTRSRRDVVTHQPLPVARKVDVHTTRPDLPKRAPGQRSTPRVTSASASSLGCIGALARLAVVAVVLWYIGQWLLTIPEVRTLVNAFRSGSFSDDQVNAAIQAIQAQIRQLFGVAPARGR